MYEQFMIVIGTITSDVFLLNLALLAIVGMGLFIANLEE